MQLYASSPAHRTRQLTADLGMLAWLVLWLLVARVVHGAVLVLAEPGQGLVDTQVGGVRPRRPPRHVGHSATASVTG